MNKRHLTRSIKRVPPKIKGLSIAAKDNQGLRFGCGVGLGIACPLPARTTKRSVRVARGTADREGGAHARPELRLADPDPR